MTTEYLPPPSNLESVKDLIRLKIPAVKSYFPIIAGMLNETKAALLGLTREELESYLNECGPVRVEKQMSLHAVLGTAINSAAEAELVDVTPFADALAARGLAYAFDGQKFTVTEFPPTES